MIPPPAPRSRWWTTTWRTTLLAVAGLTVFLLIQGERLGEQTPTTAAHALVGFLLLVDLALGVASVALYPWRRRAPLVIACLVTAFTALSISSVPTATALVVSTAARLHAVSLIIVSATFAVAGSVDLLLYPDDTPLWQVAVAAAVTLAMLIVWGLLVGERRRARADIERQRQTQEATRIAQATTDERLRIAQEMHDVLGHRLSLMSVHAGALEYRRDLTSAQTSEAAGVIRENSRRALEDLRDVLGVLRTDATGGERSAAPQPVAADLPSLIAEARSGGAEIIVDSFDAASIPDATGRHLYRIMQEVLTNARRHAPGRPVRIALSRGTGMLHLTAQNATNGPPGPAGFGLLGVAERARTVGGSAHVHQDDDVFTIEVELPCPM